MVQCPYPETFPGQVSGKTESNILYLVWHEGYEAHKIEISKTQIIRSCIKAFQKQIIFRFLAEVQKAAEENPVDIEFDFS